MEDLYPSRMKQVCPVGVGAQKLLYQGTAVLAGTQHPYLQREFFWAAGAKTISDRAGVVVLISPVAGAALNHGLPRAGQSRC